ncbi:MAG: hypothetical protein WAU88_13255 [Candidatus Zixiibacteriota bacterium]
MRRTLMVILMLTGISHAQSKVGTTAANYLNIETSIAAIGLGQLGLIVPNDCNFATNPALLPFSHQSRFLLGGNPWTNEYQVLIKLRTGYASIALPLAIKDSPGAPSDTTWRIAAAYRYVGSSFDPIYERSYNNGNFDGTGNTFMVKWTIHQVVLGLAHTGYPDFGIGGSIKFGHESVSNASRPFNSTSYDLGAYGRMPILGERKWDENSSALQLRIMIGLAVTNFGPKIDVLERQYDQPTMYRFGLGTEIHVSNCRFLLGLQQDHTKFDVVDGTHLGGEVEWHRAIALRAGQSWFATTSIDVTAFGGSLSINGLLSLIAPGRKKMPFDLKVHYSHMISPENAIYDGLNAVSVQLEM